MADTKTATQKQEEGQVRKITVDAGRLQEALKHALELEQMLVDCIGMGVPMREEVDEQEEKAAAGSDAGNADKVSLEAQLTEVDVKCPWEGPEEQGAEQKDCPSVPWEESEEQEAERRNRPPVLEEQEAERRNRPPVLPITKDDIIRIIVRKIKQDRANNELIGAILKSYGVDRVSDLPVEKYEAFLMDLTQI